MKASSVLETKRTLIGATTVATLAAGAVSGTAGAATSATSVAKPTGAADWVGGALANLWLLVTGGGGYTAGLPILRPILSNTTNTLAVNEVVGMDSSTTFAIVTLQAKTDGISISDLAVPLEVCGYAFTGALANLLAVVDTPRLTVSGCSFGENTSGPSLNAERVSRVRLEHCRFTAGADVSIDGCPRIEVHGVVSDAGGAVSVSNALTCDVTKLSATDAPSSVLRLVRVHSATAEVTASNGGATPIYLEGVANFEVVGGALTGTGNTGYGVEITGSGAYELVGSTITGGTGDVLFFGRAVTWALLSGTDYGIVEEHAGHARARASYTKAIKYGNYLYDGNIDVSGRLLLYGYHNPSQTTGISAAGTVAADATQLGAVGFARVDTVASGTGVRLPAGAALPGVQCVVFNNGANALKVYHPPSGTINGGTAAVSVPAGSRYLFVATSNDGLGWHSVAGT